MCLAIPARIVKLEEDRAIVDAMGNQFHARTTFLPNVKLGDLVLVHAGFAISMIDEDEARKTWELIEEIDQFNDTQDKVSG
jgi:hydrogenase expression/formation protein HypC